MTQIITGPGVGLSPPQNLYPTDLFNAPVDCPTNYVSLPPGGSLALPAGSWISSAGSVSFIQYLDPVTGVWRSHNAYRGQSDDIKTAGFARRIANLTGCPIGAVVAGGGTGFNKSSVSLTANVGGSVWQAIVGGALSVSTINVAGSGYSMAPIVLIPAPPSPGVPATAYATITAGSVTGVTLSNVGAGYLTAPPAVVLPNPADPNAGSVSAATVTLVLNAALAGSITAALCQNNGAPLATLSALTLTAAGGAGAGATITPVVLQTIVSASVAAGGGGWGAAATPPGISTAGGVVTATSAIGNPAIEMTGFRPRPAIINVTSSAAGALSAPVVTDPGLFVGTPSVVITPGGTLPTTLASIALTMGSIADTIEMQPL
jgi:hypothetical protein